MKVPKKWRGIDGQLHHLVNLIKDGLSGEEVVISKTWRSRYQCWNYHAEKLRDFKLCAEFRKEWRCRRV